MQGMPEFDPVMGKIQLLQFGKTILKYSMLHEKEDYK